MRRRLPLLPILALTLWIVSAGIGPERSAGISNSLQSFRQDSKVFAGSISVLGEKLQSLDSTNPASVFAAQNALKKSRLAYKKIEYLLDYFFFTSSLIYNRAPKTEIEEPYPEYQDAAGLQYIETMLFDPHPTRFRGEYKEQMRLLQVSANDLNALLYEFKPTDAQLLESVRQSITKVIALGITGFDAPVLKSGIEESAVVFEVADHILQPYLKQYPAPKLSQLLAGASGYLGSNPDFDGFDRMKFLTRFALPLQTELGKWLSKNNLVNSQERSLNPQAEHLFASNAFQTQVFSGKNRNEQMLASLGKELFFDTRLSENETKSCASCHNPEHYFTDGLPKSFGISPGVQVSRNAPTLLYAAFQHKQFWDGRAANLEKQIEMVVHDSLEMHGDSKQILAKLNQDRQLRKSFNKAFAHKTQIAEPEIYAALAAYIRTLTPFNAPFDQYIAGNKKALTDDQVAGFNLFMGKAQCGTCHFAPLFNGLIPPDYKRTEFEVIGTTGTENLEKPVADSDRGRAAIMPVPYYEGAFKTPTMRNVAATAPYMHNGAFSTLEKVVDFYDKGGGAGLGLPIRYQTLSAAPLNLTNTEKKQLVLFLESLTDKAL